MTGVLANITVELTWWSLVLAVVVLVVFGGLCFWGGWDDAWAERESDVDKFLTHTNATDDMSPTTFMYFNRYINRHRKARR